jgi:hypothetical protein
MKPASAGNVLDFSARHICEELRSRASINAKDRRFGPERLRYEEPGAHILHSHRVCAAGLFYS